MTKKRQLPRVLHANVTITRNFGYDSSGLAHYSEQQDISGKFEVITRTHLYNWQRGIDIYPTAEQFRALLAGQPISRVKWA